MRYSKEHKAETRARIVKNASIRLRERGPDGVGISDLMKDAGLTHGGFYAHFRSRDDLIGEAFAHAMEEAIGRWRKKAEQVPSEQRLVSIVNSYLTPHHRDDVGNGCALSALSMEAMRVTPRTRKAFVSKLEEMVAVLAEQMPESMSKTAHKEAIATLATMMGALILARTAGNGDFSNEILAVGRDAALRSVKSQPSKGTGKRSSRMPARSV
jgi:TetR/AcrR family transcriptional regulator, transcriptional repressor for nem operon